MSIHIVTEHPRHSPGVVAAVEVTNNGVLEGLLTDDDVVLAALDDMANGVIDELIVNGEAVVAAPALLRATENDRH